MTGLRFLKTAWNKVTGFSKFIAATEPVTYLTNKQKKSQQNHPRTIKIRMKVMCSFNTLSRLSAVGINVSHSSFKCNFPLDTSSKVNH